MLLLHQIGSVKIGEVVRYTITYTPSQDRILPSPEHLHLRIRNSSAIALRAAFVHGPYTLSVAAYPAAFNPNEKFRHPRRYGVPEFEPMLKAGGSWTCRLAVPDDIRQSAGDGAARGYFGAGPEAEAQSARWIVEVASQVIFSQSAAVHYELLLARDEKSLNSAGGAAVPVLGGGQAQVPLPGRVSDYQRGRDGRHPDQPKGVFSRAIRLKIEDTATLWNTPQLPGWGELESVKIKASGREVPLEPKGAKKSEPEPAKGDEPEGEQEKPPSKPRRVHLVVLTHGLHSNLGGDMLYLKESIDTAVKQAAVDRKLRMAKERAARQKEKEKETETDADATSQEETHRGAEKEEEVPEGDEEDEEVVVRGFSGNATRTERGIKYLGKRLARYVLSMTYPDQPYLPASSSAGEAVANVFHASSSKQEPEVKPAHKHSTIHKIPSEGQRPFKITSISFIAHSLGGLVQTYAVAYIQKHSPQFFDLIKPINFVAMATPFLGLNHENPLYVKFALDFGLVGRTGQDLGLTWRAPTIARSGWGAIVSNLGETAQRKGLRENQEESKPLLRILPTGPAHTALAKFRNRTVYSNVVNDGIVPLRTSCLLFLDWQGLGRVDKARREIGLVETLVGAGWAELTGANVSSPRSDPWRGAEGSQDDDLLEATQPDSHEVPQPSNDAILEDDRQSLRTVTTPYQEDSPLESAHFTSTTSNNANPFTGFFNFFKSIEPSRPDPPPSQKQNQIYLRSQTLKIEETSTTTSATSSRSRVTTGTELTEEESGVSAPPRTTFFESASDLINPKLPSIEYLIDPSKRPRTIFHDRIYHPTDIPPPPLKKRPVSASPARRRKSFHRPTSTSFPANTKPGESFSSTQSGQTAASASSDPYPAPGQGVAHEDSSLSARDYDDTAHTGPADRQPDEVVDSSGMKVEEKIARAYHRGMAWRKVLVKLEPDAHNNLIVRRMFANAFGWPVVKHLVDAHFSDLAAARIRDDDEASKERAKAPGEAPDEEGRETTTQLDDARGEKGLRSSVGGDGAAGDRPSTPSSAKDDLARKASHDRRENEAQEARDTVPEMVITEDGDDAAKGRSPPRGRRAGHARLDSLDWSDRDWADSEDSDADVDGMAYGPGGEHHTPGPATPAGDAPTLVTAADRGAGAPQQRSASPLDRAWNWTAEKIAGRGAATGAKAKSPRREEGAGEGASGGAPERADEVD